MQSFEEKNYPVFEMFQKQWALAAAGSDGRFNACTIGWGSLGTLWTKPGSSGAVMTVYLHPDRYTCSFFRNSPYFSVSFFPPEYRKALGYLGTHSGRNEDKLAAAGLTPVETDGTVAFREAELTFFCRKLYQHQLAKEDIADDIRDYYLYNPKVYPPDENGSWQPHWVFVGEIVRAEDKRAL